MAAAPTHDRFYALMGYFALNVSTIVAGCFLIGKLAGFAVELRPVVAGGTADQPSRVDRFKLAEAAAALSPRLPVLRTVVAFEPPELPVQVLAVRIDEAEDVKVKPMRLKSKTLRLTKAARMKKPAARYEAALLPILVANDYPVAGPATGRRIRGNAVGESARDITNRTLGVLVAMKD